MNNQEIIEEFERETSKILEGWGSGIENPQNLLTHLIQILEKALNVAQQR